jgi:hypothetical protein
MNDGNNVSDVNLRPEDSQSQLGGLGPKSGAGLSNKPLGNSTDNVLQKPIGPGGSSSEAGGFQERLGDGANITESRPIVKTGNTRFDAWMVEAQKALDNARKCAREPFTGKEHHAAWLGLVRGQVDSLESRNQDFPPDLKARCNQKTKEIRDFMYSVKQWPLTAQPTEKHVEREGSIEVQGLSKRPQDARTEVGPGDDRTQRDNQAAGTRIEETSNKEPASQGVRHGVPVPPPEANHLDRTHEQRESHTAHDPLMPSCCCC